MISKYLPKATNELKYVKIKITRTNLKKRILKSLKINYLFRQYP